MNQRAGYKVIAVIKPGADPSEVLERMSDCADHDEDCLLVENKLACWLYASELGMCPYLRAEQS